MKRSKLMICLCLFAFATAITAPAAPRDTPEMPAPIIVATAGQTLDVGNIAIARDGLAFYPSDANTNAFVVLGRIETAAVSNGVVVIKPGIYKWAKAGTIANSDVGQYAYAMGSASVATKAVATNDLAIGRILRVESDGVWVDTKP